MEINKAEVTELERALTDSQTTDVRELGELQLALIGGGIGDVVWG